MIKDGDIKLSEAEETCEAPKQKDFLALEVMINFFYRDIYHATVTWYPMYVEYLERIGAGLAWRQHK